MMFEQQNTLMADPEETVYINVFPKNFPFNPIPTIPVYNYNGQKQSYCSPRVKSNKKKTLKAKGIK